MQIILLSGGSGKRLWPLSNDARSKQFLPLLKAPDDGMESMVQRVVRQVREAGLYSHITIATNASQRDIIINQLGEDVNIVTEPERRDTFPAIALSSAYLSLAAHCPSDEIVVVMPCDPYTETDYFKTIGKMADCVNRDVADLVLMGIKPTYPSSKFGYVVPAADGNGDGYQKVARFTEKPDESTAETLLAEGAYWNGGVFAFRLGYMMNIVRKYIDVDSFDELRSKYKDLPKISFDYEVAETAESVAVLPFDGSWKDLGTWNTLTEKLPHNLIGNASMGDQVSNTHVVNELSIPIFCDGVKDLIIAASPDGILVSAKDTSENIKHYVEKLIARPMYEERRWGQYRVIDITTFDDGFKSLTKNLIINTGKNISYQVHRHRSEVWTFIKGEGILVLDGVVRKVSRGDVICIEKGTFHALKAVTELHFIEVQTGDLLVEEDIERFDWKW